MLLHAWAMNGSKEFGATTMSLEFKKATTLFVSLAMTACLLPGCSWIERNTSLDLPESKMSTAGASVATGAALGAGLGAIVGSTTGNAGEGLVLGTMAGAAAGGIIGTQLEQQEQALNQQKESLAQQGEVIAAQDREIQQLRASLSDRFPGNTPSRVGRNFSIEEYRGNPRAKSWNGGPRPRSATPRARLAEPSPSLAKPQSASTAPAKAPAAQVAAATPAPTARAVTQPLQPAEVAPVSKAASPTEAKPIGVAALSATSELPPARKIGPDGAVIPAAPAPAPTVPAEPKQAAAVAPAPQAPAAPTPAGPSVFASKPVDLNKVTAGAGCDEAGGEWTRAQHATSEADKIFYLKRAIRLCPQNSQFRVEIGKLYASIGLTDEARSEYLQAIDLDPENELAQKQLGLLEKSGGAR